MYNLEKINNENESLQDHVKDVNVNDIVEVLNENENVLNKARVLQINDEPNTKEKLFYVHFLNFEKRMDKWISEKNIIKNLGNKVQELKSSPCLKLNESILNEKNILTRKRSNMISNENYHTEKETAESSIKIKNVEKIIIGYYEIDAWYYSPYPQEFTANKILYICEYCLKYMRKKNTIIRHTQSCKFVAPPGNEIYYEEVNLKLNESHKNKERIVKSISVFEIKGEEHKLYCQNLCLIAKLFLDHKSIYYDVSPFKFYALTENDEKGKHIVAYFSKESSLCSDFNLSCIMVLPPYQRKGYGQFLIALSYHFSKMEKRICTPETPLSDLGRLSYKSYWTISVLETLLMYKGNLSIKELSEETAIKNEDIIFTLNELSLIKYWKGQQVIQTINTKQIEEFLVKKRLGKQQHHKFNPNFLTNINKN